MSQRERFKILPKDKESELLEEIIHFYKQTKKEDIGIIPARELYDFFEEFLAPHAYNTGIEDAKKVYTERSADMQLDFDLLLRS